jgi:sulfite reductase (ferredoxin)
LLKKLSKKNWADAIYLAYAGFVNGAKAILCENEKTNPPGIINLFDTFLSRKNHFDSTLKIWYTKSIKTNLLRLSKKHLRRTIAFFKT